MTKLWTLAAIALAWLPLRVDAAPITFGFGGTVTSVTLNGDPIVLDQLAALGVVPGAPIVGTYVFESTTPESGGGVPANYNDAIIFAEVDVGSYHLEGPSVAFPNSIGASPDVYDLTVGLSDSPDLLTANVFLGVVLFATAESGPLFATSDLPLSPPDLMGVDQRIVRLLAGDPIAGRTEISFDLTTLFLVPEPSALWLAVVGIGLVVLLRRQHPRPA